MFTLKPETEIQIRAHARAGHKSWATLGFIYIGAKTEECRRVKGELESRGKSEWNGFVLLHPEYSDE